MEDKLYCAAELCLLSSNVSLDCECSTMDDLLDEKIVQTSWKRSIYPKKILPYFIRSLKAERRLMVGFVL